MNDPILHFFEKIVNKIIKQSHNQMSIDVGEISIIFRTGYNNRT